MRITIDATPLMFRSAGVKNYLYHWIEHLRRLGRGHTVRTFPVAMPAGPLNHERSQASVFATLGGLGLLHFWNRAGLTVPGWYAPCDVFHSSHLVRHPPRRPRLTTTIHDMTCWLMPELHSPANVRVVREFGERVMPRAAGLIAVSESTRADAVRILGLDPARIEVIHPGVAETFFDPDPARVRAVGEKYRLAQPYALFLGTVEPRKNLPALLDAWHGFGDFDLVIAGPAGWADRKTMARLKSGAARYLGYVPEADLPFLTAGAAVFVYPSLYEGFGFPVAQAMAARVPVITSNLSSMPEVAGDGAVLVDPRSIAEIRAALDRLLGSPSLREALAEKGRARAERFRWAESAARSLQFFERVAG